MAVTREAPLDEIQFRREDVLQYWGGVHTNSIHCYIKESPFFDHTSRNGLLWEQSFLNPDTFELCASRERLEATLRNGTGLEYMVAGEPQPSDDPATQGPDSGIWVMRKQERAKTQRPGHDDLTIQGTYYAVAENLYQAPSVYDIVGNHLMSAMTSLNKFIDEASALPTYSPSTGYTYISPDHKDRDQTATMTTSGDDSLGSVSELGPPQDATANLVTDPVAKSTALTMQRIKSSNLLEQSLLMMREHAEEYMNENPLLGEPGNFVFTHTKDRLRARRAAEKDSADAITAAAAAAALAPVQKDATASGAGPAPKSESTTPATGVAVKIEAEANPSQRQKKPSKSEASGSGAGSGGTNKKRKKSKVSAELRSGSNSARNSPTLDGTSSPVASPQ